MLPHSSSPISPQAVCHLQPSGGALALPFRLTKGSMEFLQARSNATKNNAGQLVGLEIVRQLCGCCPLSRCTLAHNITLTSRDGGGDGAKAGCLPPRSSSLPTCSWISRHVQWWTVQARAWMAIVYLRHLRGMLLLLLLLLLLLCLRVASAEHRTAHGTQQSLHARHFHGRES